MDFLAALVYNIKVFRKSGPVLPPDAGGEEKKLRRIFG